MDEVNEQSGSSQSANVEDGQFIIVEQHDASGAKTGEVWFSSADVTEILVSTNEEAYENALATFQNDEGNFEIAPSQYDGPILTSLVVISIAVFMCVGAIAVQTLMRSFERR